MKIDKKLAVIMLAGIVVASAFMAAAEAKPPKPMEVKVTCPPEGPTVTIDLTAGISADAAGCMVKVDNLAPSDPFDAAILLPADTTDLRIKLDPAVVIINDVDGDNEYMVEGYAVGPDLVTYNDAAGNDKLDFKGKKTSVNTLTIVGAAGGGNNDYKADNIGIDPSSGMFGFSYLPGDGTDKIKIN